MSFPRYPKYKASDMVWLDDVPEGWEVKPLRSIFKFSKGLTITKENLQDEGIHCVNYGEIHSKYGFRLNPLVHPLKCVDSGYLLTHPDALIRDGDFVFADTSEDLGGSGNFTHLRSEEPIFAGYHTIIGRPRKDTNPLFLAYQIDSLAFRSQIQRQVKGVKVFSISQGILKATKCLLPSLTEQKAIADFLDRETDKIDELVVEQQRLMKMLKEKRQAVISHAITKGLNPNAAMKPSGVEWLGDVPDGWEIKRLKRISTLLTEKTDRRDHPVGLENIESWSGRFIPTETVFEGDGIAFEKGDILFGKLRPYLAKAYLTESAGEAVGDFHVIRPSITMDGRFVLYQILSREFISIVDGSTFGSKMPRASWEFVGGMKVTRPPLHEQIAIANFLDHQIAKFDALTTEAELAIELLLERRTALISAAVTGQIDVRNQSPKN